jgi:hypothetical protein
MAGRIATIREAARASCCPVSDLLSDGELDALIGTVVVSMVKSGWCMEAPDAELPGSTPSPRDGVQGKPCRENRYRFDFHQSGPL